MQFLNDDLNLNGKRLLEVAGIVIRQGFEAAYWAAANLVNYAVNPLGYAVGSGGTVTQNTSKATAVTLNKTNGDIVINSALLAADTTVNFTFNNTFIGTGDILLLAQTNAGAGSAYVFNAQTSVGSANITIRNITGGGLAESFTLSFAVFKKYTS